MASNKSTKNAGAAAVADRVKELNSTSENGNGTPKKTAVRSTKLPVANAEEVNRPVYRVGPYIVINIGSPGNPFRMMFRETDLQAVIIDNISMRGNKLKIAGETFNISAHGAIVALLDFLERENTPAD